MSAVSISVAPSSTARRTTRTPSSRSPTMRIAPKPSRRTSSSSPSRNVGFIAAMLTLERCEQARRDLEVPRGSGVASVGLDRDPVGAATQAQRNVEAATRVEPRAGDHLPASGDAARDGDRAAGARLDGAVEQSLAGRRDLQLRRYGDREDGAVHARGVQPVHRLRARLDGDALGAVHRLERLPPPCADSSLESRAPDSLCARRQLEAAAVEHLRSVACERELTDVEPRRAKPELRLEPARGDDASADPDRLDPPRARANEPDLSTTDAELARDTHFV